MLIRYSSFLLFFLCFLSSVNSQSFDYPHCNCKEYKNEIEYILKCDEITVENIQLNNGVLHGKWTTLNINADTIIVANYQSGKLNGAFSQFHKNGKVKLQGNFIDGQPDGDWIYFNDKGRVIKRGSYQNGIPIGVWKINNKKGRKEILIYDFQSREYLKNNYNSYYSSKAILSDDLNDEFIIAYFPRMSVRQNFQPLGGFISATEFFSDYMNIPRQFFNTYFNAYFTANVEISQGRFLLRNISFDQETRSFDGFTPGMPYYVDTNNTGKIKRIKFSELSLWLLQKRIDQLISITGPWISNGSDNKTEFEIQIPVNLNSLRKY